MTLIVLHRIIPAHEHRGVAIQRRIVPLAIPADLILNVDGAYFDGTEIRYGVTGCTFSAIVDETVELIAERANNALRKAVRS